MYSWSREKKFRFWDGNKMIGPVSIFCDDNLEPVEIVDVMQFSGLYDKNGREIYEGDIVQTSKGLEMVEFYAGSFDLVFPKKSGYYHRKLSGSATHDNDCVVVGNYYESGEMGKPWQKDSR